jgi:uncharacterized protein (DUF305 family)
MDAALPQRLSHGGRDDDPAGVRRLTPGNPIDKEVLPVFRPRTALAATAAIGLAAILAACGSDSGSSGTTTTPSPSSSIGMPGSGMSGMSGEFNDPDVTFATDMIVHHDQAIEMAKLADGRSNDAKVLALAKRIEAAQAPEIQTMSGWLKDWGKPTPEDMSGMGMGNDMPGMMSAGDMKTLQASKGAEFDRMFLTMMITHHEGAIAMARSELASGKNAEAKALGQKVIDDQTREIAEIRTMLG